MIPCMKCGQPSSTHLTHVSGAGEQTTLHLCTACAEKQKIIELPGQQLNIPTILKALIGAHIGAWSDELSRLACPSCGIKYMEFRAAGRLGCPHDYAIFRSGLDGLLKKIHRAAAHVGKKPRRHTVALERHWEVLRLRRELREAVDKEEYERAAALRDEIRLKESQA
jgi:protein arginine kinase activator